MTEKMIRKCHMLMNKLSRQNKQIIKLQLDCVDLEKENEQLKQRVQQLERNIEKYIDIKYRKFVDGEVGGWSIETVNDELQKVKEENEELKQVLGSILIEVKREISASHKTGEVRAFINPKSYNLIGDVLRKYGALKEWYDG